MLKAVQGDIATVAKVNYPFPVFWLHVFSRSAYAWLKRQNFHAVSYRPYGTLCCIGMVDSASRFTRSFVAWLILMATGCVATAVITLSRKYE